MGRPKMGEAKRRKISTAYHEAGHIVVGLHFGFKLREASIVATEWGDGLSIGRTEWERAPRSVFSVVCQTLAGAVAEERLNKVANPGDLPRALHDQAFIFAVAWVYKTSENGHDASRVLNLLADVYVDQPERIPPEVKRIGSELIKQGLPETRRLVDEHWSEIEAVASLLRKHGIVTPQLLSQSPKTPEGAPAVPLQTA